MWLFISKGTVLHCKACGDVCANEADWYISAEHLTDGRVVVECQCSHIISVVDLLDYGAHLVFRPKLGKGVESVLERNFYA